MKICIVGAGAIGGLVAAKLALAGREVTVIDQGAHLAAIRKNGLKLVHKDGSEEVAHTLNAVADLRQAGHPDVVILALKAHQIGPMAKDLRTLFGPDTMVVTVQNGLPWWYFYKHGGHLEGQPLRAADPDGLIAASIEPSRVIGCVVYPAAEVTAPGVIHHVEGDRFPVGEPDGSVSERVQRVSEMFVSAGFKSPVLPDIRSEIWLKAWGNLSFNPISALTHATLVEICQHPLTRELAANMMREAQAVANTLGVQFRVSLEKRIEGAEKVGHHKTSMLQDVEAGRTLEVDALVGTVVELGRLVNLPTPSVDAVYALVKLLAQAIEAKSGCVRLLKAA